MSKNKEYLIGLLSRLLETESVTRCEKDIANLIGEVMKDIGFDKVYIDENFNVVGDLKGSRPGKCLMFSVHSDTGPVLPEQKPLKAELLEGRPFGKEGMIVKGAGASAPKSGITAMLGATKQLSENRSSWKGSVKVAIVTKDLTVNHDGPREVSSLVKDVDFAIVSEPSDNNVISAARGIIHIKITINGKATHWGIPEIENNAVYKLGALLEILKKNPIVKDTDFGLIGFNPFRVDTKESPPALPEYVNLFVDRRVRPGESIDKILEQLDSLIKQVDSDNQIKYEITNKSYPFEEKRTTKEKEILKEVVKAVTGKEMKEMIVLCGTNAAFFTYELDIPALVLGPGNLTDMGINDHVEVESLQNAADIYYNFALKYLS